jgi:hypothetical protein
MSIHVLGRHTESPWVTREHISLHAAWPQEQVFSVVMIHIIRVREQIQARFILCCASALKKEMVCSAEMFVLDCVMTQKTTV